MKEGICSWMIKTAIVLLLSMALASCSSTGSTGGAASHFGIAPQVDVQRGHDWHLAARSRIYLTYPRSLAASGAAFPRTQAHLRRLLYVHSRPRFQNVVSGDLEESLEQSFAAALANGCNVLLRPVVQDARFGEKESGPGPLFDPIDEVYPEPDYRLLSVSLQVYDVRSGRLLDTVWVTAKRPWPAREHRENTLGLATVTALLNSLSR